MPQDNLEQTVESWNPLEAGHDRRAAREQEGFARPLSVPDSEVLTCSSYFEAHPITLVDFRGPVADNGGHVPPHGRRTYVEWETTPAETNETTTFAWIGGSQVRPFRSMYPYELATLAVNGEPKLSFPLGNFISGFSLSENGYSLRFEPRRFQNLVEMGHRVMAPNGLAGFYRLEVPGEALTAGQSLRLRVELAAAREGVETSFFISPRSDALRVDLAILRDEMAQVQSDLVQLRASHQMFVAQLYPQLFPQRIQGELVIACQDETKHYHPPSLTVMRDGEVLITAREATDHVALDGRIVAVRSRDGGRTWSKPEVLYDLGKSDHRCAPIFELPDGTWLTTDYRAATIYNADGIEDSNFQQPSQWSAWSEDKGKTWQFSEQPMLVPGAANPYGEVERHMIQLPSGRLLAACVYAEKGDDGAAIMNANCVFASDDEGRSWNVLGKLPLHPYVVGESTLLRTVGGKILLLARTQGVNGPRGSEPGGGLLQSDSLDDGQTWSQWRQTGMSSLGSPGHLLRLQDGRILCTHASRGYPGEVLVTTSADEGVTWNTDATRIVTNDITNWDSCYPTSGQLPDGTLLTTWYANLFGKYFIAVLRWQPEQL